jgi:hypothetical protein
VDGYIEWVEVVVGVNQRLPRKPDLTVLKPGNADLADARKVSIGCFEVERYEIHGTGTLFLPPFPWKESIVKTSPVRAGVNCIGVPQKYGRDDEGILEKVESPAFAKKQRMEAERCLFAPAKST